MISSHFQIFKLAHFQIMRNDKENDIVTKYDVIKQLSGIMSNYY
jgi:recombinational DNA repair protein (RecF pathway)